MPSVLDHGHAMRHRAKKIAPKQECIPILQLKKNAEIPCKMTYLIPWLGNTRSDRVNAPVRSGTGSRNSLRYLGWQMGTQMKSNLKWKIQGQSKLNRNSICSLKLNFICKKISTTIELNNFSLVCKDSIIGLKSWILCRWTLI